jgi:hypothetical protein
MSNHGADPPSPLPSWLEPGGGPIGDGDLRFVLSSAELFKIATLLVSEHIWDDTQLILTHRDGSPWIEIAVAVPLHAEAGPDCRRYALWRYTGNVYRVGADGAVEDDPLAL